MTHPSEVIAAAWLPVVALALVDEAGRLLLQQRPVGKHHGGLWEFPGGKVDAGESPREALAREISEELGIAVKPADCTALLLAEEAREEQRPVVLMLYQATRWHGSPRGCEGQSWGWFTREQALDLPLAPMDRDFVKRMSI
ncbi:(deoxy)nucleoside triphosphate pyrophosphohydrolase [Aurantiacibacter xanthus]|uniref:8-oxo-dGTP diphosphatase n=1 Tax=Aurantiacibacter xanthus TaxID=1784712 RepID=A0A3A1PAN2_9SPHN|nr:(deoxy)nucleoside triphosphate pyrophosphohydrolase [Aurantiacibacter xanthus]